MIQVHELKKSYGAKTILDGVSFIVHNKERVGLVGPNGTGKTTLFKILLGEVDADRGSFSLKGHRIGYLPQKITAPEGQSAQEYLNAELDKAWEEFKTKDALKEVALSNLDTTLSVSQLSGGQKTRLAIARLLLNEPDFLLLDEPTNNLDLPSLSWFETFIKNFKGAVLVISHDRMFLDNTVDKIFELNPFTHSINEYTGGYSDFLRERIVRLQKELSSYKLHEKKRREMEEWIALKKQQLSIYANPKVGKQLQAMKTRFKREFEEHMVERPRDYKKIKIDNLGEGSHAKKLIYKIEGLKCGELFQTQEIMIYGNERIHLQGPNGSGKTTFLRALLNEGATCEGGVEKGVNMKVGYFSQEHETLDPEKSVLSEFMDATDTGNEVSARKILGGFLFTDRRVLSGVSTLSQGERVKLIVAELTNQGNNFLILDEPTNHLDLESREVLEYALGHYHGGFLLVSHDRYFIEEVGINREFEIKDAVLIEKFPEVPESIREEEEKDAWRQWSSL